MPILVKCACGKSLNAPDTLAGKRAKCPGCGQPVQIPAASFPYTCPTCEQSIRVTPPMAGTKISCPGCQGDLFLPKTAPKTYEPAVAPKAGPATPPPKATPASSAKPAVKAAPATKAPAKPPAATAPAAGADLHAHTSCPGCNAFVSRKDALCIQCGLNLVTGRQLSTVRSKEATKPKGLAYTCVLLNLLPLPGLGTLIGGPKLERITGALQMLTALVGWAGWLFLSDVPVVAEKLNLIPAGSILLPTAVYLAAAGWAWPVSQEILKEASGE